MSENRAPSDRAVELVDAYGNACRYGHPTETSISHKPNLLFYIADLEARAEAPKGEAVAWQPKETAPKNGTHFRAIRLDGSAGFGWYDGKNVPAQCIVHYWAFEGEEGFYPSVSASVYQPEFSFTHWRPLDDSTSPPAATDAALREAIEKVREALQQFIDEKCDYMKINLLGDPEKTHTVKWGRIALAALQATATGEKP